ncbi:MULTISPECIES: COG4315 family predicted lipoprotein [Phaeobacter]|uniref:Lipoprotein n=1 Tax=Phaeobacter inhibens TaxID=221822 RepID=A0A2I7L548_9RHOB|nr:MULTISPECIES: hypothetical protein [Phaeobacter]APX18195.1 hypothetical protein BWR17_20180 [Phaeobacter inhibens]AUQ52563.1 hypothetical protein PhaeoP83_04345 [Phaeobacter inhibens]AUQ56764.1 hypothetical protein PhaeoP92_04148 [Phaeobacter inhibens]AUQ60906.1 hypothetical protein PhaeoP30_04047 [Phaeobacter inhibens]AUQ72789.1 hypothetical protein PhaeoP54_03957 [Phaeobacter inhibens]
MKLFAVVAAGLILTACDDAYAAGHSAEPLLAENGMSLYTFDKDKKNTSVCYDACAVKWPPYLVDQGAGAKDGLKKIKRKDGAMQWAKDGAPLYFWQGDKAPGDTSGDGVGGVWHLAH